MAAPNMALIAASLERSFQNCSLNHQNSSSSSSSSSSATTTTTGGGGCGDSVDSAANVSADVAEPTLELNSETSLPFHWEQCLDLKTGEVYYINWRTGMKMTEDPRTMAYYSEEENDNDSSSYDSDESSSESSPPSSSRAQWSGNNTNNPETLNNENSSDDVPTNVLVVAGCKSCLMYYMVPKQLGICPKCCGQLLHFDSGSSSS